MSSMAWRSATVTPGFDVSKIVACSTQRRVAISASESASRSWWQGRVTRRSVPSITGIHNKQQCHELAGASSTRNRMPPFANSGGESFFVTSRTSERSNAPLV